MHSAWIHSHATLYLQNIKGQHSSRVGAHDSALAPMGTWCFSLVLAGTWMESLGEGGMEMGSSTRAGARRGAGRSTALAKPRLARVPAMVVYRVAPPPATSAAAKEANARHRAIMPRVKASTLPPMTSTKPSTKRPAMEMPRVTAQRRAAMLSAHVTTVPAACRRRVAMYGK